MFLRFLFFAFLFYLAYKLLFDFVLPVYRTTKQIRKGVRKMQEHMQQPDPQAPTPGKADGLGEYIDFEEVK